jgi:hypothetical protein
VSILVGDLGRAGGSRLVGDVVDAVVLIGFANGINHGSVVSLAGETLFLQVPLLVAVPADDVWVPGAAGAGLDVVVSWAVVFLRRKAVIASLDDGNLFNLLVGQVLSDDFSGILRLKFGLDRVDPV